MKTPKRVISMSMSDYREADAVSKSDLDLIHRSPAHYKQAKDFPEPPTPAMLWGSMFHSLVLEPEVFKATYAVLPEGIDRRTKEGKEQWADWQAEHTDKTPVDKPTMVELTAMREAVLGHSRARSLIEGAVFEPSIFWEYGGVKCKVRPDIVNGVLLADLKSCIDARPDEFSRTCWRYRYHVQDAYYSDGFRNETGENPDGFLFVCCEKTPPYAVAVYLADETMSDQGRNEYLRDLEVYAECLALDKWPGYTEEVQALMLPGWAQEVTSG